MKPWCAEVPTAANLNLYRGWRSCVGWHRDGEPLFGECGDAKLIVSVALGLRRSPNGRASHSCWLGRGDVLVMDGHSEKLQTSFSPSGVFLFSRNSREQF